MAEAEDATEANAHREPPATAGEEPAGHAHPADASARGGAGGAAANRLLDQNAIDDLLGLGNDGGKPASGVSLLVDNSIVSYERLPMLEVVFDRLVRILTTSLRNFTSENVEVAVEQTVSLRLNDYVTSIPLPAMISVFRAVQWDNYGLLTVDSALIYAIVDVLLGGRHGTAPLRVEGRPYTTIERNLVERMIHLVLHDMGAAFDPLSEVAFRFERLETNPRFAGIAHPTNAAILFRLKVEMEDRGGHLEILIPYATLEPVRDLLLQMFMGEKFGRDSIWEHHLARQMMVTSLELEAVLEEQTLPLATVMQLAVGNTLPLSARPDAPITLRCGHVPLLRGRIGRVGEHVAVRIDDMIERNDAERC